QELGCGHQLRARPDVERVCDYFLACVSSFCLPERSASAGSCLRLNGRKEKSCGCGRLLPKPVTPTEMPRPVFAHWYHVHVQPHPGWRTDSYRNLFVREFASSAAFGGMTAYLRRLRRSTI